MSLRYLTREYGICDENGRNYFLDYFVRTKDQKYAIEENGLDYHHPQIIGEEKYRNQLKKQNTCALWGIKLFRFSKEDCESPIGSRMISNSILERFFEFCG